MYRPQFAFPPTPENFIDEDFVYNFDGDNIPALNIRFAPGQVTQRIPLPLQSDAAFLHRGLKMNQAAVNAPTLGVQIFDPKDRPLSNDYVSPSAYSPLTNNPAPPLEPEIENAPGASYQISVANLSETQSTIPLQPVINPVLVDPVTDGTMEYLPAGTPRQILGPVLFNGAIYMPLVVPNPITIGGPSTFQIFQSLDGGKTWTGLNNTGAPNATTNMQAGYDGNGNFIIAFSTAGYGSNGSINLQNFSLLTGTWGAVYGTASPPTTQDVGGVFVRPDGSIAVIHNPSTSGAGTVSGMSVSIYSGGAWTTTFDAGVAIQSLSGYELHTTIVTWMGATVDTAGNLHLFFQVEGGTPAASWNGRVFYQLVEPSNALGTFADFATPTTGGVIGSVVNANPTVVNDQILLGIVDVSAGVGGKQFPSALVGSPLSAPVFFSIPAPGMDPNTFDLLECSNNVAPVIAFDGQTVFALYAADNGSFTASKLRLCYNNSPNSLLSGWGSIEIYDLASSGFTIDLGIQLPAISLYGSDIFLTMELNLQPPEFLQVARYFMGLVEIEPLRIQFRGVKRYAREKKTQVCGVR